MSEQVEKRLSEVRQFIHDYGEDPLEHHEYYLVDLATKLAQAEAENERLRGLLDHLNSINYSASGELGNLWPITGELQDQIDATLEEQEAQDEQ